MICRHDQNNAFWKCNFIYDIEKIRKQDILIFLRFNVVRFYDRSLTYETDSVNILE